MPFEIKDFHKTLTDMHVGCEAPRAYFVPYHSEKAARSGVRDNSDYFKTLCGCWDFKFYNSVTEVPDFRACDVDFFDKIDVPMNWQYALGKEYDKKQYTNVDYPFPLDPPYIPVQNPAGLYRRTFTISEEDIKDKSVMLNFEGVDSCFYVFINNSFVGYSSVSHMTSEFDVTKYVSAGINEIKVLVLKWNVGSYLEDQDMFRASGIFREVYLLYRDTKRISDVFVRCDTATDFSSAEFFADIKTNAPIEVSAVLYDADGVKIDSVCQRIEGERSIRFNKIEAPKLWSDEDPYLYRVVLSAGEEIISIPTGARRIEIKGRVVYINGKKVKAKGVNRHDSHYLLGHATPMEHMLRDIMILKAHNVNFVRTSHYPNDPRFAELCDKYGLFLCDEADLECHGAASVLSEKHIFTDNPDWQKMYLDRAERMLERDKNHPSIVMWSVGNESGSGINHKAMVEYYKGRDNTRLVHLEDESRVAYETDIKSIPNKKSADYYREYIDIESRMYPNISNLEYYKNKKCKKPFFMCEYSHAMGNGPGDLKMYWDYIYNNDSFFGGCVWEFTDHAAVIGDNVYANPKFIYGGDSGEFPHFGCFCVDGLVYPDRRIHTGLLEYKQIIKPFFADYKNGILKIKNARFFKDLSDLSLFVELEKNGEVVESKCLGALNIKPQAEKSYKIDAISEEYTTLNVYVRQNTKEPWADVGYEVGSAQFIISQDITPKKEKKQSARLVESSDCYTVFAGESVAKISRRTGLIESFVANGKEMLTAPITPTIWRAPTDNDRRIRIKWQEHNFDREGTNLHFASATENNGIVEILAELVVAAPAFAPFVTAKIKYIFGYGEGVKIECLGKLGDGSPWKDGQPRLPRFGFKFRMPEGMEDVRYFGYGPYESYEDKRLASRVSLFKTTVTDNFEHYVRPQENSSHYGCKWADVTGTAGYGLYFSGESFSLSVSHYDPLYLTGFNHDYELVPEKDTTVIIDYRNSGIGSASCGPDLQPEYRIEENEFFFSFSFKPSFAGNVDPFYEYVK